MRLLRNCILLFGVVLLATACLEDSSLVETSKQVDLGYDDFTVAMVPPEFGYQVSSAPMMISAGTERYVCSVVKIEPQDGERLVWLTGFESITSKYTHHMNVHVGLFSFVDAFIGGEAHEAFLDGNGVGTYDCSELGDLMESAVPIYPSQRDTQIVQLPEGVGMPSIAPMVMVMEHHYINTSDRDVLINAALNMQRMEDADVEHVLTGFFGIPKDFNIPGNEQVSVARTCVIDRDVNLSVISSHTHDRAQCFTMNHYEAQTSEVVQTPFFVNKDWESPPLQQYDLGDWKLNKGDGIHYACHYVNHEDRDIGYGLTSEDEMCIFVAVGYPSKLTPEDIRELIEDPLSFDLEAIQEKALVGCEEVVVESPWSMTEPEEFGGDPVDICTEYEQTPNGYIE